MSVAELAAGPYAEKGNPAQSRYQELVESRVDITFAAERRGKRRAGGIGAQHRDLALAAYSGGDLTG